MKQTTTVVQQVTDINEDQLLGLIQQVVPELYAIDQCMNAWGITQDMIMDFMGAIHRVKDQGWGSVVVTIQDGQVKMIEGKTTKLYAIERYIKNV